MRKFGSYEEKLQDSAQPNQLGSNCGPTQDSADVRMSGIYLENILLLMEIDHLNSGSCGQEGGEHAIPARSATADLAVITAGKDLALG